MKQQIAIKRILLIDDDPVTNMINTTLISRQFDVEVAAYTNAQEALKHLNGLVTTAIDAMPGVIFLDINMPIMDGWEFLEAFQQVSENERKGCSVIMLTSSINADDIEKSKGFSVVKEFISKPLDTALIKSLLERISPG